MNGLAADGVALARSVAERAAKDALRCDVLVCPPATILNRIAEAMREKGGLPVWLCMTAGESGDSIWPIYHDFFFTEEKGAKHRDQLTEGAEGHALWPELDARPEDTYVFKNRFSAFIQGACGLDEQLRSAGIENLLITGTATNFCCETSARDAMMLGYRVVMVSDGCAARYDEDHAVGLTSVFQSFGDVMTTDQVIDDLLVAAQPAEPAAP
jgi:nicotinamidase-related amidase